MPAQPQNTQQPTGDRRGLRTIAIDPDVVDQVWTLLPACRAPGENADERASALMFSSDWYVKSYEGGTGAVPDYEDSRPCRREVKVAPPLVLYRSCAFD